MNTPPQGAVVITGANGKCGTALLGLPGELVFLDRVEPIPGFRGYRFHQADVGDRGVLLDLFIGARAVVHLAAASSPESSWEEVASNNIEGTRNVLEAARTCAVERVVLASSNHVVGMHEIDHAPALYSRRDHPRLDHHCPVRPDSYYGVSKAAGEALGRFFAESGGPRCYVLRIGAVLGAAEDHPFAYAERGVREGLWGRGTEAYERQLQRLRCIWQSRRDFRQMVARCLEYDGPSYDVFYGVSDNATRWFDLDHARTALGYEPQDRSEDWEAPPHSSDLA